MPNANENMAPDSQGGAMPEPVDLAQAFKALNQANREAAQEPVATGEPEEPNDGAGSVPEGTEPVEGEGATAFEPGTGDGGIDDRSSGGIDAIDFNAQKQQLLRDVQQEAIRQTRKAFADENIGYYSMAELTVRDEQTGRVMFRNPDVQDERDPNYYFKSRSELQQFVEAWNKGVDYEYRKAVNSKAAELVKEAQPKARMYDFMPRWNSMDESTRAIFDDLLEGHEIRDSEGKAIGFDVDLNAVANQAEKIARRFTTATPQTQQPGTQAPSAEAAPQAGGPALDLPAGNGRSADEKEPTNIGEALKMWDKQNRKGK